MVKFRKNEFARNSSMHSSMMSGCDGSVGGYDGPLNFVFIGRSAVFPTILVSLSSANDEWYAWD